MSERKPRLEREGAKPARPSCLRETLKSARATEALGFRESSRGQVQLAFLLLVLAAIIFLFVYTQTPVFSSDVAPVHLPDIPLLTSLPKAQTNANVSYVSSLETPVPSGDFITRTFSWEYDRKTWKLTLHLDPAGYETYQKRSRQRDYDLFASDPFDDGLITDIANSLRELARDNGLSESELAELAVSFVQSLPYTSDDVTTPFDEYPRFPYETLFDNGGDCEDTSILAAAVLHELGYRVVLLELPSHMALGVECDADVEGYAITYEGVRYCYLETTGENWPIGTLPDEYEGIPVTVIPVERRAVLDVDFKSVYRYNAVDLFAKVDVIVKNTGSEDAHDAKVYVALQTSDKDKVWDQVESGPIELKPEDTYSYDVTDLHAPSGETFRIYVRAYGDNIVPDEAYSEWITWD